MDIMEQMDDSFNHLGASESKHFIVVPPRINTGTIARRYFPIIQTACQSQIKLLQAAGDYPSFNKVLQIEWALGRLNDVIHLKEAISKPTVKRLIQKNQEEDICRLHEMDFSQIDVLLEFQSFRWWWISAQEAEVLSIKSLRLNRHKVFYSIADALASTGMECADYLLEINPGFLKKRKRESLMLRAVKQVIDAQVEELDDMDSLTLPGSKLKNVRYRIYS